MTINLKFFRKDKSMRPGLEVRTQVQVGSKAEEICKDYWARFRNGK